MKVPYKFTFVVGAIFVLSATVVSAGKYKTPVAPADYLAKTNPYSVDDLDEFKKATKKIYKGKCKKCHGSEGDGQGSGAEDMDPMPTAFNAPGYLKGKKDGQLFWIIEKGSDGTEMSAFGPGSEANLSEEEIWKLITYIRSKFTN
ncbi:MAG: c-type cytochrome [Gammaproteobacteria bacterium]|nr:c-type cytochrome [Gammaproteobacteria bacterium]